MKTYEYQGEGFCPVLESGEFRCCIINSTPRLEKLGRIEYHTSSDEIFMLISGSATLYIGEECVKHKLIKGKLYSVPPFEWHGITLEKNSSVLIVENRDTGDENTVRREI